MSTTTALRDEAQALLKSFFLVADFWVGVSNDDDAEMPFYLYPYTGNNEVYEISEELYNYFGDAFFDSKFDKNRNAEEHRFKQKYIMQILYELVPTRKDKINRLLSEQ
ncbi:hypothetical protein [Hymenobacter nivis]|uniref:Uncharacterized protein n=1 Tax=Hymenobacter nivis TaxID=1850093 RepID=A0A2Z3GIT8_9BACT|nr:hypothetical protein [Hymenobacter nivis]AWM32141.1 hypothetical protein DDQ68_04620 [Hymenobacter nivis]